MHKRATVQLSALLNPEISLTEKSLLDALPFAFETNTVQQDLV